MVGSWGLTPTKQRQWKSRLLPCLAMWSSCPFSSLTDPKPAQPLAFNSVCMCKGTCSCAPWYVLCLLVLLCMCLSRVSSCEVQVLVSSASTSWSLSSFPLTGRGRDVTCQFLDLPGAPHKCHHFPFLKPGDRVLFFFNYFLFLTSSMVTMLDSNLKISWQTKPPVEERERERGQLDLDLVVLVLIEEQKKDWGKMLTLEDHLSIFQGALGSTTLAF